MCTMCISKFGSPNMITNEAIYREKSRERLVRVRPSPSLSLGRADDCVPNLSFRAIRAILVALLDPGDVDYRIALFPQFHLGPANLYDLTDAIINENPSWFGVRGPVDGQT
ncbi:hypothetical protein HAX54_039573 [Datura stramonium]|uniref:Uncharacterized protein n=1 Tax=Datura stramonium TaxID=4076 RepID=A0ABS8SJ77_DATST|nr:hypothetical protein [Datura stramonium]